MVDYNIYKVPIFTGINDYPVAPSMTRGGNVSHFYHKYNQLIDAVVNDLNNIQNKMATIQTQLPPLQPTIDGFQFPNINTVESGGNQRAILGTIPITGRIVRITIDEINDGYGTSFIVEGNYLIYSDFQAVPEGAEWTYADEPAQDVTQGQEIILETTAAETNRTVSIYILS